MVRDMSASGRAVVVGALITLLGCSATPPPKSQRSDLLGDVMPAFESTTLSGNPLMSAAYQGHKMVVSFASAECEGCASVLSAAQSIYADERELVVVGVFEPDDVAGARAMARRLELKFPILLDNDGSIARHFKIDERPRTFVVDGRGRVRWVGGSDVTADALAAALRWAD